MANINLEEKTFHATYRHGKSITKMVGECQEAVVHGKIPDEGKEKQSHVALIS